VCVCVREREREKCCYRYRASPVLVFSPFARTFVASHTFTGCSAPFASFAITDHRPLCERSALINSNCEEIESRMITATLSLSLSHTPTHNCHFHPAPRPTRSSSFSNRPATHQPPNSPRIPSSFSQPPHLHPPNTHLRPRESRAVNSALRTAGPKVPADRKISGDPRQPFDALESADFLLPGTAGVPMMTFVR
jgi:hypothetical protein